MIGRRMLLVASRLNAAVTTPPNLLSSSSSPPPPSAGVDNDDDENDNIDPSLRHQEEKEEEDRRSDAPTTVVVVGGLVSSSADHRRSTSANVAATTSFATSATRPRRASTNTDLMRAMNLSGHYNIRWKDLPTSDTADAGGGTTENNVAIIADDEKQRRQSQLILELSRRNLQRRESTLHNLRRRRRRRRGSSTSIMSSGGERNDSSNIGNTCHSNNNYNNNNNNNNNNSNPSSLSNSQLVYNSQQRPSRGGDSNVNLSVIHHHQNNPNISAAAAATGIDAATTTDAAAAAAADYGSTSTTIIDRVWPTISIRYMLLAYLVVYIGIGWAVFTLYPGNELTVIDGYFETITIGWSVGLAPRDPTYAPNPWFASFHILSGAALIAVLLTKLGEEVEEDASMNLSEALSRHEDYVSKMRTDNTDNTFLKRVGTYIRYNAAYLIAIAVWMAFVIIIIFWSMYATKDLANDDDRWGFPQALYFAISLCSSAGSFSLPPYTPEWAYLAAGLSMMIGVPLMALAVSCIIIMIWQGQRFRRVHDAAWEPISKIELDAMSTLELLLLHERNVEDEVNDDAFIMTKGEFVLLGLLRMGQDGGIIGYLSDAYDARREKAEKIEGLGTNSK